MKKVLIPLLLGLALIVAGCSSQTSQTPQTPDPTPEPAKPVEAYQGLGKSVNFRLGPGSDSEGVPVYSFNIVMADATFDNEGRIINAYVDAYEVSTPNYDGASMPHFTGWPGADGYNFTDHATAKVTGVVKNDEASAQAEVNGWKTKRERGADYGMNWTEQMDAYQEFFKGKTVDEIEAWITKYTSDRNGRPLKADATDEQDAAKYNGLSDTEKQDLAELTSTATISLNDAHGNIVDALRSAYENRVKVTIPAE